MGEKDSADSSSIDGHAHMSFAENPSQQMVHVSDVARGLGCNCRCPGCGGQVIARKGAARTWHFAHFTGAACSSMTWLHRSAQQILFRQRRITLPTPEQALGHRTLRLSEVNEEFPVNGRRVDCLCVMEDGHELAVEIRVTHEVDAEKLDDLRSANPDRDVVEIDLRPFRSLAPDWDELTRAVCDSPQNVRLLYDAGPLRESDEADGDAGQPHDAGPSPRQRQRAAMDRLMRLISISPSSVRRSPSSSSHHTDRRKPVPRWKRRRRRR